MDGVVGELIKNSLYMIQVLVNASLQESGSLVDLFSTAGNRKGLMIAAGLTAGQQLSGINVVLSYTQSIFLMTGSSISPTISSIIFAVIQLLSAAIPAPLVSRFGMKLLLIASGIGMGIFQVSFIISTLKYRFK